jgi:sulfatase maturation enzyme AslB (radical SAM superfamily)
MTTNLYNITEKQIIFMLENNFSINTSIDSAAEIHNKNRPAFPTGTSFDKIEKNISLIKKLEKKYNKNLLT